MMDSQKITDNREIQKIADAVRVIAEGNNISDEKELINILEVVRPIYKISDGDFDKVMKVLIENMRLRMDTGAVIRWEEHKSWYLARTRDLKMRYTDRNLKYLSQHRHLNSKIVSSLDSITNDIIDGFGDPSSGPFKRRGLVIGDVQSGKTNTYTTLCCKAADVGYQVIVLLTGTLENLRKQTQDRLDEGFVGEESTRLLKKDKSGKKIGVGCIDPYVNTVVFTTSESDFRESNMVSLNLKIDSTKDTILLVVKKNKDILSNLYRWLEGKNASNGIIDKSLLMIDDEADNASINSGSDNITVINGLMRDILKLFTKTTYVGFTATPFANIFIDPESTDEMKGDDLFPRNFIYSLNPSDNYIGPTKLFGKDAEHSYMVRIINDAGECIPEKHPKDYQIKILPSSLKTAIRCFVLSCAIRDLRGDYSEHMSMLVNVSRFTEVQESIKVTIEQYIFNIKNSIQAFSKLPGSSALECLELKEIKDTWDEHYSDCGVSWNDVQWALDSATKTIQVRSVNQKNGAKNLNYKDNPDGLRLIAIGGNSLSRGLTLEGLCVSYFYRKSQTYDTLMQMGRWFGYRDGYEDLCRIWMSQNSIDWYEYISKATEELKMEIVCMQNNKKTPEEFGLLVRNDISGLYITARNKMRATVDKVIIKSVNGRLIDTEYVYVDKNRTSLNNIAVRSLISNLSKIDMKFSKNNYTSNIVCKNVPKKYILNLIENYQNPESNIIFDTEALLALIYDEKAELDYWDISIQHGDGDKVYVGELLIDCVKRARYDFRGNEVIRMSRGQLSSPNNTVEGIYDSHGNSDRKEIERLEAEFKKTRVGKSVSARAYLETSRRRPILIIYYMDINPVNDQNDPDLAKKKKTYAILEGERPIGLAVGFPKDVVSYNNDKYIIRYKANAVYSKLGNPDLDEEDME